MQAENNMTENNMKQIRLRKLWMLVTILICCGTMTCKAQSDYFNYDDIDQTIISGLTYDGTNATELTIPATVTKVNGGAFYYANPELTSLTVENGGNPVFENDLFGGKTSTLTAVNMGDAMSVDNMYAMLISIGASESLSTVEINGYTGDTPSWDDDDIKAVLTSYVHVIMPSALVADQVFGDAGVYGRFTINKEIITYCGNATFLDVDDGSNMLFYVADECKDDQTIHIKRVRYLAAGQGMLIHRTESSSGSAVLQRIGDISEYSTEQAEKDKESYAANMLIGVTVATAITATDDDKTNLVLKDGAFHPTTGGTIGANKAYLQVPTTWLGTMESLAISFPDDIEETTGVSLRPNSSLKCEGGHFYDLQGNRINPSLMTKGIYIVNGKKYIKH